MKKNFIILFLFLFVSVQIVFADTNVSSKVFGGRITAIKATEIKTLEDDGYTCSVPGTSITISPVKGPKTYLIETGIKQKNRKGCCGRQINTW